ncbi:hypothetical protein SELMODRAFT_410302 [Selaginella moellendorffii]|uniref:Uncharacterized protein n=1 Tax=Selaginella moellendorffii TaxID=88036 RepID=D8REB5_SELML|nr:hypothetical protein SELMODRAFT_410302 [Selaginella moellendorffii]
MAPRQSANKPDTLIFQERREYQLDPTAPLNSKSGWEIVKAFNLVIAAHLMMEVNDAFRCSQVSHLCLFASLLVYCLHSNGRSMPHCKLWLRGPIKDGSGSRDYPDEFNAPSQLMA